MVACSDGENGLETRYGWKIQSDVPNFPYVGGAFRVAGWNDPRVSEQHILIKESLSLSSASQEANG